MLIDPTHPQLSVARQCALLGLARSSFYYRPVAEDAEELALMRHIDEQSLRTPCFGSRQMTAWLRREGLVVNRKRVRRLMRRMGLQATAPGPHTSRPHPEHPVYPYLLGHLCIERPGLVPHFAQSFRLQRPHRGQWRGPARTCRWCPLEDLTETWH